MQSNKTAVQELSEVVTDVIPADGDGAECSACAD